MSTIDTNGPVSAADIAKASNAKTAGSATSAPSQKATNASGYDKDMFLKLLVAQLRYQDPTKPMDSSQFMVQTAQFNQMEQMQSLTEATNNTLAFQRVLFSGSLVGRSIDGFDSAGASASGKVASVEITAGTPSLVLDNGKKVAIDKVGSIH